MNSQDALFHYPICCGVKFCLEGEIGQNSNSWDFPSLFDQRVFLDPLTLPGHNLKELFQHFDMWQPPSGYLASVTTLVHFHQMRRESAFTSAALNYANVDSKRPSTTAIVAAKRRDYVPSNA